MALASRYLTITQGSLTNDYLSVTEALDLFPEDVLGGPDRLQEAPRTVSVQWGDDVVNTDIDRTKNILRKRGWSKFFDANRIQAGDRVLFRAT